MRQAWRAVIRAMRRADDPRPWWRRVFEGPMDEGDDDAFEDDARTAARRDDSR